MAPEVDRHERTDWVHLGADGLDVGEDVVGQLLPQTPAAERGIDDHAGDGDGVALAVEGGTYPIRLPESQSWYSPAASSRRSSTSSDTDRS